MHRDNRTHLLVTGGSASRRLSVTRAFHDEGPVQSGPLLIVECSSDTRGLSDALDCWLSASRRDAPENPLRAAERGTLFLDNIATLDLSLQRRLFAFAQALGDRSLDRWVGRLATGAPQPLEVAIAAGRFLPELLDCLDQVRISLEPQPGVNA